MKRFLFLLVGLVVHCGQYAMIQKYDAPEGTFSNLHEVFSIFAKIEISHLDKSHFENLKNFFLEHPQKINYVAYHDGTTALHSACLFGRGNIVQFLLERGAKLRITDNDGMRPIHYVERIELVMLLLKKDKNILSLKTTKGLTLLDVVNQKIEMLHEMRGISNNNMEIESIPYQKRLKKLTGFREQLHCFYNLQ